ncbi:hypothetical protein TrVFT333_006452 [Trichoderma virens FT-333]|nr:hypothetical protein TrVFT333_006452 [Trichoderma virens FT-333]
MEDVAIRERVTANIYVANPSALSEEEVPVTLLANVQGSQKESMKSGDSELEIVQEEDEMSFQERSATYPESVPNSASKIRHSGKSINPNHIDFALYEDDQFKTFKPTMASDKISPKDIVRQIVREHKLKLYDINLKPLLATDYNESSKLEHMNTVILLPMDKQLTVSERLRKEAAALRLFKRGP